MHIYCLKDSRLQRVSPLNISYLQFMQQAQLNNYLLNIPLGPDATRALAVSETMWALVLTEQHSKNMMNVTKTEATGSLERGQYGELTWINFLKT